MKIIKTGGRESFVDLPLKVDWILTYSCNYRCSYCFHYGEGKNPPKQLPFSTLEQLKVAVNNILSLNRPWYEVTLSGGEPTIHPHIFDLISMLHKSLAERLRHIWIITNGSRNKSLYGRILDIAKLVPIRMTISIHTDHVDMAHILELIESLSSYVYIRFSLMFNPAKREMVHEIYKTLHEYRKKFYFDFYFVTLRDGDHLDPRYTPNDFEWQNKATNNFNDLVKSVAPNFPARRKEKYSNPVIRDIEENGTIKTVMVGNRNIELTKGLLQFKGKYCIAHATVLRIEQDGRCRGMVCTDDKFICNVYEENSLRAVQDKLIHAVKCTHNICGCPANDPIPKFASEEDAKKYVEFAQKRQAQLFEEYFSAQHIKEDSKDLPYVISNDIIGISESALEDYFGKADVVRKITEYEYNNGDKKSKVIYKAENGIITEATCSLK